MTEEFPKWVPVYITSTTPADEAGNFYVPSLVPAGAKLPVMVTDVAPTVEQLAAGKPLKFDWLNLVWVESGEDPATRQIAILAKQLAQAKADAATKEVASAEAAKASKAQIAALALKLATATKAQEDAKKSQAALALQLAKMAAANAKPTVPAEPDTDTPESTDQTEVTDTEDTKEEA